MKQLQMLGSRLAMLYHDSSLLSEKLRILFDARNGNQYVNAACSACHYDATMLCVTEIHRVLLMKHLTIGHGKRPDTSATILCTFFGYRRV